MKKVTTSDSRVMVLLLKNAILS